MGLLRLFLAISVLATHLNHGRGIFGLGFLNGGLAVQCFFIISGFYMALVLNEKYNYRGSYWTFIQQRFLRLYPLYFVVGILILVVEGAITYATSRPCGVYDVWGTGPRHVTPLSVGYYVLVNLTIFGQDSLAFLSQDNVTGRLYLTPYTVPHATYCLWYIVNVPTWTLAIELTFYLVAPFLVRGPAPVQAAFLLASFALRSVCYFTLGPQSSVPWIYYFWPSTLFFFMAGSLGYHFYKRNRAGFEQFAATHAWIFWIFGAFILAEGRMPFRDYLPYLFVPAAIVVVPLLFAHTHRNKKDRLIGELSYPYYLIHYQVIVVAEYFLQRSHDAVFGPLCAALTFGLAALLYWLIEIKTERYREQLFQKAKKGAALLPVRR
jgi:peptidoglycan/LPS O-acetylase OafA/YrhL